ncbi:hypothetical protein GW17_00041729, partial [Ensete ventricosum]
MREKSGRFREKKGRRRRGGKEEKRREKGKKEIPAILARWSLARRRRSLVVVALARFSSRARRQNVSHRREKDQGD